MVKFYWRLFSFPTGDQCDHFFKIRSVNCVNVEQHARCFGCWGLVWTSILHISCIKFIKNVNLFSQKVDCTLRHGGNVGDFNKQISLSFIEFCTNVAAVLLCFNSREIGHIMNPPVPGCMQTIKSPYYNLFCTDKCIQSFKCCILFIFCIINVPNARTDLCSFPKLSIK
jgi:hypothetical protein